MILKQTLIFISDENLTWYFIIYEYHGSNISNIFPTNLINCSWFLKNNFATFYMETAQS